MKSLKVRTIYGQAYDTFKEISKHKSVLIDYGLDIQAGWIVEYVDILESKIDKAIDKLYCWGETLNPDFQKEMLDILKENK